MKHVKAGKLKVEEWHLPGGVTLVEVPRNGSTTQGDLESFQRDIVDKLIAAGAKPSDRSKTEIGAIAVTEAPSQIRRQPEPELPGLLRLEPFRLETRASGAAQSAWRGSMHVGLLRLRAEGVRARQARSVNGVRC